MDFRARQHELIARLAQGHLRGPHVHPGVPRTLHDGGRLRDVAGQPVDGRAHGGCPPEARVVLVAVAGHAQGALTGAEQCVGGSGDRVVTVAVDAGLLEHRLMRAALEAGCKHRVARAADIADRVYTRRRRPVVPVAVVAGRRGQIPPLRQGVEVHARPVVRHGGDGMRRAVGSRHPRRVGVARPAGRRHVGGVHGRLRIRDGPHTVRPVTAHAGRDAGVAVRETPAVGAGGVLHRLVHALLRREGPHVGGIAVAPRARLHLGLAIAKHSVERHGGTLIIACPPSGGTIATVSLPADDTPPE